MLRNIIPILAIVFSLITLSGTAQSETVPGHTAGQFQVSETGAATYTVPITVPTGTAGVEPKLALSYSSQGRNSLLGTGWSLSGLSVISRCPATLAQDGFIDGVDFDAEDRFCLDGERLMAIGGIYGADATEYRTEQDTFRRVVSHGQAGTGPASFTVWTKSGLIMEFGGTEDSRIEAEGKESALFWVVNRIADSKGNYLTVTYDEDNTNGEYRPTRIDYTGNDGAELTPYASVRFDYEDRTDIAPRYVGGSWLKTTKRLATVQAFDGEQLYREYLLAYGTSPTTGHSRLESITECGSDGNCFAPTELGWQEGPSGFEDVVHGGFDIYTEKNRLNWLGDYNGDGLTDFASYVAGSGKTQVQVSYSTGSSFTSSIYGGFDIQTSNSGLNWTGDFNGDGLTDLASYLEGSGGTQVQFNYSTGSGFTPAVHGGFDIYTNNSSLNWLGDFNGDGLTDLASYVGGSGGTKIQFNYSTGSGFTSTVHGGFDLHTSNSGLNWLGDFNGDGLTDLASYVGGSGGSQVQVNYSNGAGFIPLIYGGFDVYTGDSGLNWPGDFNGDGLTDLSSYVGGSGGAKIQVNLSTGSGFTSTVHSEFDIYTEKSLLNWQGDFNGDGLTDLASYVAGSGRTEVQVNYSTGSGFTHVIHGGFDIYTQAASRNWTGDFNGDGVTDLSSYVAGSGATQLRIHALQHPRQLLDSIETGHGLETTIAFAPLTSDSLYTKDDVAVYPLQDFQGAMYAVSSYSASNGIGGQSTFNYQYGGAKINLHGRGFRGFDRTTITDQQAGIATTVFYERDHRCISSKIRRTEQRQPDGTLISEVDNTIEIQDHGFGVHFSYVGESVARQYELDGSLVSTVTTTTDYDEYGNVLTIRVDFDDGQTETTVNTYDDDLDNWFLGRLIRSEVTKTATGHPDQTRTSAFSYDPASGLLTTEVIEPDASERKASEPALRSDKAYLHDALGNITASTSTGSDITARTHSTVYDALGRYVVESINALGHTESKTYHLGNLASLTGPNELTTSWQYDGFGRQTQELRADGTVTDTGYLRCAEGECPDQAVYYVRSDTTGAPSTISYRDVLDREVRQETQGFDGTPIYVDTEYNALGQVARVSEPYFAGDVPVWTVLAYDLVGRVVTETVPGDRITSTAYAGRTTTITNPLGQTSTRVVDARGQLVSSTDNNGNTVTYEYDAFGNLTTMIDPGGNVTSLTYDIRGNKAAITDPDTGTTQFRYDSLGELISQTDANGTTITMAYDPLGRMTSRTEPEGTSTWMYDTASKGIGKPARISRGDYTEAYTYDDLGRLTETRITIGGETFTQSTGYDLLGRPERLTYPTGFAVRTLYNAQGYAQEVRRLSDDHVLWKADFINARGQLEQITLGNGLVTTRVFDPETGRVDSIRTGSIQHLVFGYDTIGNLELRRDELRGLSETFVYDGLNRLTSSQVTGQDPVTVVYDALGNITSKSDVGAYTYGENGAGPHAVTSISGSKAARYTYDANGNRTRKSVGVPGAFEGAVFCDGFEGGNTAAWNGGAGGCGDEISTVVYTSFNKPHTISDAATTLTFDYGPEYDRYRQLVTTPAGTTTKLYVGGMFERESADGYTKDLHYIRAGDEVVAVYALEDTGLATVSTIRYLHRDHLGSVQAITDETGAVVEVLSFDPWGLRRNAENWSPATAPIHATLDRGFTGHEHLDEVSLIHMNGRVYDPVVGRFLSADPFVQVPEFSQSLNRYSYVLNNPLSLTDPSGFFFKSLFRGVRKAVRSVAKFLQDNAYNIVNAIGIVTGHPILASIVISVHSGVQSGASFGDILKDTVASAAIVAATRAATDKIGGKDLSLLERTIAHGVVQGTSRSAQGGKFEHGFLAGAFGELGIAGGASIGRRFDSPNLGAAVGGVVAGGTSEELGGGKFSNGAFSGAFIYAIQRFSQISNSGRPMTSEEINEARKFYGDTIEYSRVRIFKGGYFLLELVPMAPDGNIYFPGDCGNLATCGDADLTGILIHELAHVQQYQGGVNVFARGAFLHTVRVVSLGLYNPYDYSPSTAFHLDKPYNLYNIEQQGDIMRDRYLTIRRLGH